MKDMSTHDSRGQTNQTTVETFRGRFQHSVDTIFLSISRHAKEIETVRQLQPAMKQLGGLVANSICTLFMGRPQLYKTKAEKIAANRAKSKRSYNLYVILLIIFSNLSVDRDFNRSDTEMPYQPGVS